MSEMFGIIVQLGDKLTDLCRDHAEWSQKTFGSDEERGPVGPLKHLEKEAREAQQIWIDGYEDGEIGTEEFSAFKEELADCLLLILDASRRGGVKPMQLIEAGLAKLDKNKARAWPKSTPDEPVEHVKVEANAENVPA